MRPLHTAKRLWWCVFGLTPCAHILQVNSHETWMKQRQAKPIRPQKRNISHEYVEQSVAPSVSLAISHYQADVHAPSAHTLQCFHWHDCHWLWSSKFRLLSGRYQQYLHRFLTTTKHNNARIAAILFHVSYFIFCNIKYTVEIFPVVLSSNDR